MSHSHGGSGAMGSMSMGDGDSSPLYLQQVFWAFVGGAIGVATAANISNKLILWQRLVTKHRESPARPKNFFTQSLATTTAIFRELAHTKVPVHFARRYGISAPTVGQISLVLAELVLVILLCFYKLEPSNQRQWEDIGYRTGFISATQLPLVVLLAGKNNIIGLLIGSSYERLNWLHRWVSRILFLTVTVHMGFWFTNWDRYDYIKIKLKSDAITQRGFAAWCLLLWIVLSSLAPMRKWNYEFFVVQHVVTFIGFLISVFLHLPTEAKIYIWIPIVLYLFDRTLRTAFFVVTNVSLFHPKSKYSGFWTCRATLDRLSSDTARIVIKDPPVSWRPGQHVFLSCHGIAPLQSHPFTIASLPEDKSMAFFIKRKSGATKRFLARARESQSLPVSNRDILVPETFTAVIDGPYGRIRDLRQFDSVFFIAGGSGGSFTVPLMRDLVASWKRAPLSSGTGDNLLRLPKGAVTRYIRFIWVIKSKEQYAWFASEFAQAVDDVQQLQENGYNVELGVSIYITCDVHMDAEKAFKPAKTDECFLAGGRPDAIALSDHPQAAKEQTDVKDASIMSSVSTKEQNIETKPCRPNCICTNTIEDEDAVKEIGTPQCCCCNSPPSPSPSSFSSPKGADFKADESRQSSGSDSTDSKSSSSPLDWGKRLPSAHQDPILVLAGRPNPKSLIRNTLEQALGESAVVVCGSRGLHDDVRHSVVSLSDERAVHKGTGAQGIFFWGEGFES